MTRFKQALDTVDDEQKEIWARKEEAAVRTPTVPHAFGLRQRRTTFKHSTGRTNRSIWTVFSARVPVILPGAQEAAANGQASGCLSTMGSVLEGMLLGMSEGGDKDPKKNARSV